MESTESRLGGVGGFGRAVDERGGRGGDGALLGPEGGLDAEGARLGGAGGLLGGAPEVRLGGAGGLLGVAETFATEGGGREGGGFGGANGDERGADTEGRVDGVGGRDSLGLRASLPLPASSEELDGRGGTDPPGRGGIDLLPSGRGGNTLLLLLPPEAAAFFDPRLPLPPRAPFDELFDSSVDLAAGPASGDVLSSPIAFDRNSWFFRAYTQTPDDAAATS